MASLVFEQDDKEEQLLAQALYVDEDQLDVDDDDQGPPASGEEYLKKVVRESKKLKFVETAANAEELLGRAPEKATHVDRLKAEVGQDYIPTKEWQDNQVREFSDVRLKLNRHFAYVKQSKSETKPNFPSSKNEAGWCTYCFGTEFWLKVSKAQKEDDEDAEEEEVEETKPERLFAKADGQGHDPLLEVISSLKQMQITRLIEYQAEWAEALNEVDVLQALWFYSLLSAVEKPLHPDVGSAIRSFVLVCSKYRSALIDQKSAKSDIAHLNLIICLVAKYFGQSDLADE